MTKPKCEKNKSNVKAEGLTLINLIGIFKNMKGAYSLVRLGTKGKGKRPSYQVLNSPCSPEEAFYGSNSSVEHTRFGGNGFTFKDKHLGKPYTKKDIIGLIYKLISRLN